MCVCVCVLVCVYVCVCVCIVCACIHSVCSKVLEWGYHEGLCVQINHIFGLAVVRKRHQMCGPSELKSTYTVRDWTIIMGVLVYIQWRVKDLW